MDGERAQRYTFIVFTYYYLLHSSCPVPAQSIIIIVILGDINEVQEHIIEILIRPLILSFTLSPSISPHCAVATRKKHSTKYVTGNRWEDNFVIWTHVDFSCWFLCCTFYGVCAHRFDFVVTKRHVSLCHRECPAMYQHNLLFSVCGRELRD